MTEKIDIKHPRFAEIMATQNIEYPSTVHHFEEDEDGNITVVDWSDVKSTDVSLGL